MTITSATEGATALKKQLTDAAVSKQMDPANLKTFGAVIDRIEVDLAADGLYGPMYDDALKLLEASPNLRDKAIAAEFRKRDKERAVAAGAPMPASADPFTHPKVANNQALTSFFSTCQPSLPKPGSAEAFILRAANTKEVAAKPATPSQPPVHTCEEGPKLRGQIAFKAFPGPLFSGGQPNPGDVVQRNIGNCWFASAMSSMAKNDPAAVKNMIKDNGNGTYTVSIYDKDASGKVQRYEVLVDGQLPFHTSSPNQSFYSGSSPLWYAIIEKAYAKHLGGYQFLANNDAGSVDACFGVTGVPSTTKVAGSVLTAPALFASLVSAKHVATVSTTGVATAPFAANHVYSVTRVYEENGKAMVELRNPWGPGWPPVRVAALELVKHTNVVTVS